MLARKGTPRTGRDRSTTADNTGVEEGLPPTLYNEGNVHFHHIQWLSNISSSLIRTMQPSPFFFPVTSLWPFNIGAPPQLRNVLHKDVYKYIKREKLYGFENNSRYCFRMQLLMLGIAGALIVWDNASSTRSCSSISSSGGNGGSIRVSVEATH